MTTKSKNHVMTVGEVMTKDPICVLRSASLQRIAEVFTENDISGVPVVDEMDCVVGVISKTDIIRRCVEGPAGGPGSTDFWESLRTGPSEAAFNPDDLGVAEDLMSTTPVCAKEGASVKSVARQMVEGRIHRVIVVDEERHPIGIATALDLLRALSG